jgi:hypothetical protein
MGYSKIPDIILTYYAAKETLVQMVTRYNYSFQGKNLFSKIAFDLSNM